MLIFDTVYEKIREQLASFEPERGGALYGLRGYPCVTHFEYDPAAQTTGATYLPSAQLIGNVQRVEMETGLEFKGIIHSHPRGYTRPSRQDEWAASKFFELNPHHSRMAMPIVQEVRNGSTEVRPFLHWYQVERARSTSRRSSRSKSRIDGSMVEGERIPVVVVPDTFHVIPLYEHLCWLVQRLFETTGRLFEVSDRLRSLHLGGADLFGLVATAEDETELMFFASMAYPVAAPMVLHRSGPDTKSLRFAWDGTVDPHESLERIANSLKAEWDASLPIVARRVGLSNLRNS